MTYPKALLLILAVLAVGLLAACEPDHDTGTNAGRAAAHEATRTTAPDPAPADEEVAAPAETLSTDQVIAVLRVEAPYFDAVTDGQIADLGQSMCTALDSGASLDTILTTSITSGVPGRPAGSMLAAAVYGWCPGYVGDLTAYVNS